MIAFMENTPNHGKKKVSNSGKGKLNRRDEQVNVNGPVGREDGYEGRKEAQEAINEAKEAVQQAQHAANEIQQQAQQAADQVGEDERGILGSILGGMTGQQTSGSSGSGLGSILGGLGSDQQSGQSSQSSGLGGIFGDASGSQQASGSSGGGLLGSNQSSGSKRSSGGLMKILLIVGLIILAFILLKSCMGGGCSIPTGVDTGTQSGIDSSSLFDTTAFGGTYTAQDSQSDMQLVDLSTPQPYTVASTSTQNLVPVTTVSNSARAKYTNIRGNGQDEVTVMVFMCGTDLESKYGMATNDLNEMLQAKNYLNDDKVNIIVETGGCKQWKNNVISNQTNQRYRVTSKGLQVLDNNLGKRAMTKASTLTDFIKFCSTNYPADRYMLIFWDHGGGSISGYGYDQFASGSMTLDQIDKALTDGGVKFDFIGFDACLMATLETATVCERHGDYLIGSEETEPGCGWFYTNWLAKLSQNTSINTVELAKTIIDDFNEVCRQNNCGDTTTLSITDLAEFKGTVPDAFGAFATSVTEMLSGSEYQIVSKARSGAKQFGAEANIDHIDLIHFAALIANSNASGADEAKTLISALQGCIKYNRTSTAMKNSYGMSIYFPYKNYRTINSAVSVYNAIGMDSRYSTAVKNFASMVAGGQLATGSAGSNSAYGSLFGNLGSSSSSGGSSDMLGSLLGSFLGGGGSDDSSVGSLLGSDYSSWFNGRMVLDQGAYFDSHALTNADMLLEDGKLKLSDDKWALVNDVQLNVFVDDGTGYIDLGMDRAYDEEGSWIVAYNDGAADILHPNGSMGVTFDGSWMTINGLVVPYYYVGTTEDQGKTVVTGYVPALLSGAELDNELVYVVVVSEDDGETYFIAGARYLYQDNGGETETLAKGLIELNNGDKLTFICDYYDYNGNYKATYVMDEMIYNADECVVEYEYFDYDKCLVTYCLTDIYNNEFWTESVEF